MSSWPAVGSKWVDDHGGKWPVKVMAVVDNWIMARRSGCIPFVMFAKDWEKKFIPAEVTPRPEQQGARV